MLDSMKVLFHLGKKPNVIATGITMYTPAFVDHSSRNTLFTAENIWSQPYTYCDTQK